MKKKVDNDTFAFIKDTMLENIMVPKQLLKEDDITLFSLYFNTIRILLAINKKFNHSNQTDFKKLESIICSAFNKYNWVKQMRDIQAQIYVDIIFKHPFLDGNKRTALYWIYKLTHDAYDKFDEYTFKGIIEALEDK